MPAASEPVASPRNTQALDAVCARLNDQLYARAKAGQWQLPAERLAQAFHRSASHYFRGGSPSAAEVERYLESLHLEDLALACACAEGSESAWDYFVREFRPVLYAAARAIGGEAGARDLADSLYAELYGVNSSASTEQRKSLFEYFHGRSKLSTWLRAVLAQRHVDRLRSARRLQSLDDPEHAQAGHNIAVESSATGGISTPAPDPDRPRYLALLQGKLTEALAALDARDRLRLSYYYVQELTLAEISRLLGEHEATVSRKLDRTRRDLRKRVERALQDPHGSARFSEAQVRLCFEYALEEWPFDLTGALSASPARSQTPGRVGRTGNPEASES